MLRFRIPNKSIVSLNGHFENVADLQKDGFYISDFEANEVYRFVESNEADALYFTEIKPLIIPKEDYIKQGTLLVQTIQNLGLQKTVLSRVKAVDFDETKSLELFHLLEQAYPNAFVYYFSDERLGTWLGATPEVLFRQIGQHGFTISLAGTKKIDDSSPWSKKEKNEQVFVTNFIQQALEEVEVNSLDIQGPYTYEAGPVKHLRTDFSFDCHHLDREKIIFTLHPTPAVSGLPQNLSLEVIRQIEPHSRNFYTGFIGWCEEHNTHTFVNLRCCQIQKGKLYLYLGGGYTADSIPEDEWQETENKSRTILNWFEKIGE